VFLRIHLRSNFFPKFFIHLISWTPRKSEPEKDFKACKSERLELKLLSPFGKDKHEIKSLEEAVFRSFDNEEILLYFKIFLALQ